jgi:hypothetical protein
MGITFKNLLQYIFPGGHVSAGERGEVSVRYWK